MNPQRDWHSEYDIGQPDPALQQEPASAGRIAVYAIGAIVILGVVFYGLNRPAPETVAVQQGTSSTSASAPSGPPEQSQNQASQGSSNAPATTGAAPQDNKNQPQANQSPQSNSPQGNRQPEKAQ